MSTEPDPTQTDHAPEVEQAQEEPQPEPPIETEPPSDTDDPVEDTDTPPPPGQTGGTTVTVEPATWYQVTSVCSTTDMGNGQPCPGLNVSTTEPLVYSNAGTIRMTCGLCSKLRPILDVTKLDPQPEMS